MGRQRWGADVCFFTGDRCRKEIESKNLNFRQLEALRLWRSVQTQWRVGFGGPTGLDYGGVEAVARAIEVDLPWVHDLLVALEREQLDKWAKEAEAERKKHEMRP